MYKIYAVYLTFDEKNNIVWMVDGEMGFMNYPGDWTEDYVRYCYRNGFKRFK